MNKYGRYLKTFTILAALLGFTLAAWSDAGEGREPASPGEVQEPNAPAESKQLTTPVENRQLAAQGESQESTGPEEGQELPSPGEGQEPTGSQEDQKAIKTSDSWDTYKIIVERNMFSRQRGPRVDRSRRQRQVPVAPPVPDPESYVVLKGIVQEDGAFIAFLEDTQSGQILRVRQGDGVVRGKIKALTLDSIEYEFEDKTTTVTMGLNLQGGRDGTLFTGMYESSQTSSTTPPEGTTESSSISPEDEAEILRQLMERRQQQIGK